MTSTWDGPPRPLPPERRRQIGAGLLAFGAIGIVLLLATAAVLLASLGAVGDAAEDLIQERDDLVQMLEPAADAIRDAATTAEHTQTSLTSSAAAAREGASLTDQLATAFDQMGELSKLEIFGTRPFGPAAGSFTDVAAKSRTLSGNLRDTANALATDVTDIGSVVIDLRRLNSQFDELKRSIGSSSSASPGGSGLDAARFVLVGLLAWLAVPALASLYLGWRLWRRSAAPS